MPLIEKANRLATTSIKELGKKAFPGTDKFHKHNHRHRDRKSPWESDSDHSFASRSRHRSGTETRTLTRRANEVVVRAARLSTISAIGRRSRRHSTGNLGEYDDALIMTDESGAEANRGACSNVSTADSGAVLSRSSHLQRQHSMEASDTSPPSSSISKATTLDRSASMRGSVRDSRRRTRARNLEIPSIEVDAASEHSEDRSNQSSPLPTENEWPLKPVRSDEMIPRDGFFWQILLYLRLARSLPVRSASGKVDAYVKVKYRGKTFLRSHIISNSRNPVWDQKYCIPITNLNYPLELRVYDRDAFKKDEYIGRVMVHLSTLTFGIDREFTMQLNDETGRSLLPFSGELNFWMTLGEVSEMQIPSDRKRSMLKQIKEDRQVSIGIIPMLSRVPSDISQATSTFLMRRQWSDSVNSLTRDLSRETPSEHPNVSIEEYEPEVDEWLLPSAASFYQPQWPLMFYNGTKVEFFTAAVADKSQTINISQITSNRYGRNEVRLQKLYNRGRLLVNLIRGEDLGNPIYSSGMENGSGVQQRLSPKSKFLNSRGMERAVIGRPLNHTEDTIPAYVATLSIGKSSHKSRQVYSYSSPCWHQYFEFRLRLGEKAVLNVEITDYGVAVPLMLFRGHLDFERQVPDWTGCFTLKNNLENYRGHVVLLVTLTGLTFQPESTRPASPFPDPDRSPVESPYESMLLTPGLSLPSKELLSMVESHYSLARTLENRKDVGWLHLVVRSARDLASTERAGKVDPYCTVRLVNRCVQTSTIYRTVTPSWNQAFVFPISDIYDVLEITVLDEDKRTLLGSLSFPVIQLANRRCKWYTLKDKKLRKRARGAILLESYIVYNPIRAALRVVYPRETSWVFTTERVHLRDLLRKYVPALQQKIDRITPFWAPMARGQKTLIRLYNWENRLHSFLFLTIICVGILIVQPYMILGGMMMGLAFCWLMSLGWFKNQTRQPISNFAIAESDEEDYEEFPYTEQEILDEDSESELNEPGQKTKQNRKKPLKVKLAKAREVLGTLQGVLESFASLLEKIDCLIKWQVPWLSLLFFLFLLFITLLTYLIPVRYLLVFLVTKRFTKRLRNAKVCDLSPMSIISRIPNREQRIFYRELRPKLAHNNTG